MVGGYIFTHEPAIFPICDMEFIRASATALLDDGRAIVLLIHVKKIMNAVYVWAIKNLR